MRKIITSLFLSGLVLSVAPITAASAKQIPPKTYSTCSALRKDYPNGVAMNWSTRGATKAAVKTEVYNINYEKLDKKITGLMCVPKTK
jgi:hypothetical protein